MLNPKQNMPLVVKYGDCDLMDDTEVVSFEVRRDGSVVEGMPSPSGCKTYSLTDPYYEDIIIVLRRRQYKQYKDCPFCGGTPVVKRTTSRVDGPYAMCESCGAEVDADMWNERATPSTADGT